MGRVRALWRRVYMQIQNVGYVMQLRESEELTHGGVGYQTVLEVEGRWRILGIRVKMESAVSGFVRITCDNRSPVYERWSNTTAGKLGVVDLILVSTSEPTFDTMTETSPGRSFALEGGVGVKVESRTSVAGEDISTFVDYMS